MNYKHFLTAGLLAVPLLFFAGSAGATAVSGQANIAGNVSVTNTDINFASTFTTSGPSATETGDFAGLTGGTIKSLVGGPVSGTLASPITDFVLFNTPTSTIHFDLTYIAPGVGSVAGCGSSTPGAECTPIINGQVSPFTLFQLTSNTVVATLQMNGDAYIQPKDSGFSSATGIFSTQTALNGTIPEVLAEFAQEGGVSGITYSASFSATPNPTPTPEPASMLLMGVGLVAAGVIARRRPSK